MHKFYIWVSKSIQETFNLSHVISNTDTSVLVEVDTLDLTKLDIAQVAYSIHPIPVV